MNGFKKQVPIFSVELLHPIILKYIWNMLPNCTKLKSKSTVLPFFSGKRRQTTSSNHHGFQGQFASFRAGYIHQVEGTDGYCQS